MKHKMIIFYFTFGLLIFNVLLFFYLHRYCEWKKGTILRICSGVTVLIMLLIYITDQQWIFNHLTETDNYNNITSNQHPVESSKKYKTFTYETSSPNTGKYTAVIVEPRQHAAMQFVLNNFMTNLDNDWNFVIFHGTENENYVKDIIDIHLSTYKNRITLVNMGVKNMTVADYSMMFYEEELYKYIPTETFLVFQTDSIILKENKHKIRDFMQYDYVGAPWPKHMGILGKMEVGNGGLSLRKKSKMLSLLPYKEIAVENGKYGKYLAEDQFFNGYHVRNVNIRRPALEKAKEFSVESFFCSQPFGVHKLWLGVTKNELEYMTQMYPDIATLIKLNK